MFKEMRFFFGSKGARKNAGFLAKSKHFKQKHEHTTNIKQIIRRSNRKTSDFKGNAFFHWKQGGAQKNAGFPAHSNRIN